jgi:glucokinase
MGSAGIEDRGAVGVDIGGHGVKAVRVTVSGELLDRAVVALAGPRERGIDHVEATVEALVTELDPSRTLPVGVGIPGFHDHTADVLRQSPNFPGWENQPVGRRLRDRLGVRVATENDANCALLGEAWIGAAAGIRNVAMLTLGTGVGSGFLVGGTLLTGARGAGAEAGHILLHRGGRLCGCGRRGCLEIYVSGPGFAETGREERGTADPPLTPEDIFAAAEAGEAWAQRAVARFCSDLADGLVQIVHLVSPAAIVIGGGVAGAFPRFAPAVERLLEERAIPACLAGCLPLRAASLGGEAGAVGAARLVLRGEGV